MNSNQEEKDLKIYNISYHSMDTESFSNLVSSVKVKNQQIPPQTLLYSSRKVDWNWVHINKKLNFAEEEDLEIISNFGESSFNENEIIEKEPNDIIEKEANTINLEGFQFSGLQYRHFKQPAPLKFPAQYHQHEPLSTFKRSFSPPKTFGSSFIDLYKESDDDSFHGQSSDCTSWKFLDGKSNSNFGSPSLNSEISHHSLYLEEEIHESSGKGKLSAIKLDNELDSLILPSPVFNPPSLNSNNLNMDSVNEEQSPKTDLDTPRAENSQEEKIPAIVSSQDIFSAYISQFYMVTKSLDIDTIIGLIKTNSSGSDPW